MHLLQIRSIQQVVANNNIIAELVNDFIKDPWLMPGVLFNRFVPAYIFLFINFNTLRPTFLGLTFWN